MISWFQRISFRNKLLFTNFTILFIALITMFVFYMSSISSAMEFNMSYIHQFNEQVNMTLDMALETNSAPNFLHFVDNDMLIQLRKDISEEDTATRYEMDKRMTNYLKIITLSRTNTLRSTIVTRQGNVFSSYEKDMLDYLEYMEQLNGQLTWEKRMEPYYTGLHSAEINGSSQILVTAVYQMYDIGASEGFAYLYLDMDFSEIVKTLNTRSSIPENISSLAIIAGNEVIYNSKDAAVNLADWDEEELSDIVDHLDNGESTLIEDNNIRIKGVPCIAAVTKNESTGWYILQYMPKNTLLLHSMRNVLGIGILLALLLMTALTISILLSNYVSRPITELSKVMGKAKEGKVRKYEGRSVIWQDEVGNLIQSYNDMGERINESINRIYIYHLNQKQTQLQMLQLQINPHFLYNVLHMISSIAKLEEVEAISGIAEGLSDMLRYNIKGSSFVTLEEELRQIENYIHIQSMRFPDRYQVKYKIEERAKRAVVSKFILQPIVENAMEHGFAGERTSCGISIRADIITEELLVVEIQDNGIGIEREQLAELNKKLSHAATDEILSDTEEGIGLANVNGRLKNTYGKDYGITVFSEKGKGTSVMLKIRPEWNKTGREGADEGTGS